MDTLIWLLKVNVAIILLYAFYKLFFQRDTFFNIKRITLLSLIVFSLIYPFFDVKELFSSNTTYLERNLTAIEFPEFLILSANAVEITPQPTPAINITGIINAIWISGVIVLFLYFIFQIISILSKILLSKRMQIQGVNVRVLKNLKTPFSFFNCILINPEFHDEQELSEILHHEQTHIKQGHTWDVIFSELFCILCWFNPFVWLMKKEIRMNLEFLADNFVMKSVKNAEHYQFHLLRLSYHKAIAQLSNNFNVSPLKKRIQMMNKKKSSSFGIIKYTLFVPLFVILLFVNNLQAQNIKEEPKNPDEIVVTALDMQVIAQVQETKPKKEQVPAKTNESSDEKKVFVFVEQQPIFPGGEKELRNFLTRNIRYPMIAVEQKIQGTVIIRFMIDEIGKVSDVTVISSIHPSLDKEAVRIVSSMPDWIPGKQNHEPISVYYTLPVRFRLQDVPFLQFKGSKKEDPNNLDEIVVIGYGVQEKSELPPPTPDEKGIFQYVDEMPKFPGGEARMMSYLNRNIRYPVEAQEKGIQGVVVVRFVVDKTGEIKDVAVMRSLDPSCDEEAIRVVKAMPKWIPGKQNGKEIDVYYVLPIRFLTADSQIDKTPPQGFLQGEVPDDVVIVVDGKVVSREETNKISQDRLESVNFLENQPEYGGKNVIMIQLKK